ncbi:unnamed protein product [Caenorhabditis nigoni]
MPLLSKEKKKMAMEKVEVKAKNNGIEIPAILTDLDEKSGMPKLFRIEEQQEGQEPPKILEELVQKQIEFEDAAAENAVLFKAHDANTQTDILLQEEKCHQTDEKQYGEDGTQTEAMQSDNLECETQTETIHNSIAETQTISYSRLLGLGYNDTTRDFKLLSDNNNVFTKYFISSTKTEGLHQKCRRAFAGKSKPSRNSLEHPVMSDWKDVEESETQQDEEEEELGSVESLHWDPVDGMHAEKQLPVKKLKALFDSPKGQCKLEWFEVPEQIRVAGWSICIP